MTETSNETKRTRQRFDVELAAEVSLVGHEAQEHQCRLTNLSASGACLHFEAEASCRVGMDIAIKLLIPETIMHIPISGEIVWVKQQRNEMQAGVKFKDILSEIMMQRLVKNGIPETPYKRQ
jgi:hypothetical protein